MAASVEDWLAAGRETMVSADAPHSIVIIARASKLARFFMAGGSSEPGKHFNLCEAFHTC